MTEAEPHHTLTEFLLARIHDDECLARMAFGDHNDNEPDWFEPFSGVVDMKGEDVLITGDSGVSRHIVNWSPARVLAECEAKRRVIDTAEEASGLDLQVDGEFRVGQRDEVAEPYIGGVILRALAAVYADHRDYDEGWRL